VKEEEIDLKQTEISEETKVEEQLDNKMINEVNIEENHILEENIEIE
jgi:hypothetical protein